MNNAQSNAAMGLEKKMRNAFHIKRTFRDATQLIASCLLLSYSSFSSAGPAGGNIIGGSGGITQSGLTTNINQLTNSLAIDWASFNVNQNEIVNFLQPGSNSIALNRILSGSASEIHGQINANGHIVLVNPNGIFFGQSASVNVGGLIASGLDIDPVDFMNGDYIFNEVLATDGTVINAGIINASLGGNVTLLGKQVRNEGVISAHLGSVSLAAGKAAVLTFDNQGLLGVKITKAILQNELGIDPAVINNGDITAEGGRVLLTASVSQDVFSQAVNTGGIQQTTSVVVHEDGTFTLGAGSDVVNTGQIDVSTVNNDQNAGRIVLLGENVTSSGVIKANAENANGGDIELHSVDTTLLTESSNTEARSENTGKGGVVKILGNKVGVTENSVVDVSGATGGGQVLIGGDFQGDNKRIRNAGRTYIGSNVQLFSDALLSGNGGKIINWGNAATWFYGSAYARGGVVAGDGGLVEISGKSLSFDGQVETYAINGDIGTLLFDPTTITIHDQADGVQGNDGGLPVLDDADGNGAFDIGELALEGLSSTTDITLSATSGITINDLVDDVLNLQLTTGSITFIADNDANGSGDFTMDSSDTIRTQGGAVTISGDDLANVGSINTTGAIGQSGGAINLNTNASGEDITVSGDLISNGGIASANSAGNDAGAITINATRHITLGGDIMANGSDGDAVGVNAGGSGGAINISAGVAGILNVNNTGVISSEAGDGANSGVDGVRNSVDLVNGARINLNGARTFTASTINLIASSQIDIDNVLMLDQFVGTSTIDGGSRIDINASIDATNIGNNLDIISSDTRLDSDINITSNAGSITFSGPVRINTGLNEISVNTGLGGGDIIFTGAITSEGALDANTLTLTAGTGSVTISGDVGTASNNLNAFTVASSSAVTVGAIQSGGGGVDITSTGNITLVGNVFSDNDAAAGNIALTGNVVLASDDLQIDSGLAAGDGDGDITITGNISNSGVRALTFDADGGDIQVTGTTSVLSLTVEEAGSASFGNISTVRLNQNGGGVSIGSVNAVDTTITTGSIQTFGTGTAAGVGNNGGAITLNAQDITVGSLITAGSNASGVAPLAGGQGGAITLDANNPGGSKSITLNGNINTNSGTGVGVGTAAPGLITMELNGNNAGSATINHLGNFITAFTITSNTGNADTLNGANNAVNTWNITAANDGNINSNVTFDSFENLVGGTGNDEFNLTAGTSSVTSINGGAGANVDVLNGRTGNNTWNITGMNSGDVDGVGSFQDIEVLIGNTGSDDFDFTGGTITGSIQDLGGTDSLTANDTSNNWVLTSATTGSVNSVASFSGIENLIGGTADDTLQLDDVFTFSGSFDGGGGAGTDTVIGGNRFNTWNITAGNNTGTVAGLANGFSNVNNLIGNLGFDLFNLHDSIDFAGSVDGGADLLNFIFGGNRANTWVLTGTNSGTVTGLGAGFSNIQQLTGDAGTDDFTISGGTVSGSINGGVGPGINTLTADDTTNNWVINNPDSGTVTGIGDTFFSIGNLIGGTGNDTFVYAATGTLSGMADGGGGTGIDTINVTAKALNVIVEIGTDITANINVNNVEVINANNLFTNTLLADDVVNAWQVTGDNAGSLDGATFTGFSNLTGGSGVDAFTIFDGTIDGQVLGMAGADTLSMLLTGSENGEIFFDGGVDADVDTISLSNSNSGYTGQYENTGASERIRYTQAGNTYDINFTSINDGDVTDSVTASSFTVNGSAGDDAIVMGTNTYEVNGATQIVYSNKTDVIVDGLAGNDNLNINGNISISGLLTLMIENIAQAGATPITAGTLLLENVVTAGSSGSRLNTNVDNLRLSNVTGDVFINEQNDINITELTNVTGELDLVSQTGDILDGADLVSSTNIHLDATTGNIILNNNNQLSGELFLIASNDVTLNNTVATTLGDVSAQNLTITSNGITNSATSRIRVSNNTTLNGGGQNIILDGSNHQFNDITVSNTNDLTLVDSSGLTISDVDVTSNADISAAGDVALNSINAGNTANVTTTAAINDNNGDNANVTANNVVLHAESGIGSGDAIETVTASLDVVNSASDDVEITNTGAVELIALKNTGSSGNITIFNDEDFNFNPGSVVANRDVGDLLMTTQAGSFLGLGDEDISNPDITAQNATFFGRAGTFGTFDRPLTLDVPGFVLVDTRASFNPLFVPPGPSSFSSLGLDFSGILGALSALGGEQLVEVESLGEIDEAIFTDLQNFSMEEISLRMPRDQLFEDELEEYDRL